MNAPSMAHIGTPISQRLQATPFTAER
jgi:hypothetical protein